MATVHEVLLTFYNHSDLKILFVVFAVRVFLEYITTADKEVKPYALLEKKARDCYNAIKARLAVEN